MAVEDYFTRLDRCSPEFRVLLDDLPDRGIDPEPVISLVELALQDTEKLNRARNPHSWGNNGKQPEYYEGAYDRTIMALSLVDGSTSAPEWGSIIATERNHRASQES